MDLSLRSNAPIYMEIWISGKMRLFLLCVWILALVGQSICQPLTNQDGNRYKDGTYIYEPDSPSAMRLGARPTYMIVAPNRVRPGQTVRLHVTLFESQHEFIDISATILKNKEGLTSVSNRFFPGRSVFMEMKMPDDAGPGNYSLKVRGAISEDFAGYLFENETRIMYNPKQVSLFVTTDRTVYMQRQWVNFRVIGIQPNLLPVESSSATIYAKDADGNIVRRWLNAQLYFGFYQNKFKLEFPVYFGWCKIEVHTLGQIYDTKFRVEHFPATRFDVNLTLPTYVLDRDNAITGTIIANFTNGMPVRGNGTLKVIISESPAVEPKLKPKLVNWVRPPVNHGHTEFDIPIPYIEGVSSVNLPLSLLRKYVGDDLSNKVISVYAEVYDWFYMENKTAEAKVHILSHEIEIKFLGGRVRTFKPGVPMDIYVSAYGIGGNKMTNTIGRVIHIEQTVRRKSGTLVTMPQQRFIIPDSSIIHYTYTPSSDDELIRVTASYREKSIFLVGHRQYSKQNHYLSITTSTPRPQVDRYMVFTVRTTTYIPEVQYMLLSKGNILVASTLYMQSQQKTFSLAISRDMVPVCRMVAFGIITNSGEILADSLNFHVDSQTITSKVKIHANYGQDVSGNTVDLNVESEPSSFILTSGADYDLYNKGVNPFMTEYMLEEELATYDDHANTSFKHTWYYDDMEKENVHFNAPSFAIDANTTFSFSGLTVFTDADLVRNPLTRNCNITNGDLPCFSGKCYAVRDMCDGEWHCEDGADELGCEESDKVKPLDPFVHMGRIWTHYDDALWLWHKFFTQPNGKMDVKISLPYRPGWWMASAISLSQSHGIQFVKSPHAFYTGRRFYMVVELPPFARKGEQLGAQIAMFNYYTEHMEVLVVLRDSEHYRFIHVEDFGYVSAYNPRTSRGDHQIMVYLRPGEARYVHFPILPVIMGKIQVTIEAHTFFQAQTVSKTCNIVYDGVSNLYHTPYFIDMINSGSLILQHLDIAVPEQFVVPNQREHLYVPGSGKSVVSLTGDVFGPVVKGYGKGAWQVLQLSSGHGESYMFDLAVNLYWLKYLKTSGRLDNETLNDKLNTMNSALIGVMPYKFGEGWFSQFRANSIPSVWITSFALETLSDAIVKDWEHVFFVDVGIINSIAGWLIKQQNKTTGAFSETGVWFDRKMLDPPYMVDDYGRSLNISLTAYITIALAKSLNVVTGDAAAEVRNSMEKAAEYLSRHLMSILEPFQLCITTYALFMAKHRDQADAYFRMQAARRESTYVYWSEKPIPDERSEMIDTVQYLKPHLYQNHEAKAVQGTAYALMVYLFNNNYDDAIPIMKWLQTQRNTDTGFSSTQDTLVALQALTVFADMELNRNIYNMEVRLFSTSSPEWTPIFKLEKDNFLKEHASSVPRVFGSVVASSQGTGYALLQMTTTVNVEHPFLIRRPVERAFDLDLDYLVFSGRNGSRFDASICAKWLRTDLAPRSGFAMVEFYTPTGYRIAKQTLKDEERWGPSKIWKRSFHSPATGMLELHIAYIPAERTCFRFHGHRWYPVANSTIQYKFRVYELYEPGNHNTSLYTTYDLYHHHICQVCGSYQCPYCPAYNSASQIQGLYIYSVLFVIQILICVYEYQLGSGYL